MGREKPATKKQKHMKIDKIALVSSLGLLLASGAAQAQPAGPPHGTRPPRGPMLHQGLADLLDRYDINKDGQLDAAEMASLKADVESGKIAPPSQERGRVPHRPLPPGVMEQYDVNKDGTLDETERESLQGDIQSGKLTLPGRGGGGPPHRPRLTAQQLLERFDTNKDSALDAAELETFLNQAPPPGPRHESVPPPHAPAPPGE
jgi:Ca2+-binding EF-hand superfamily protein